MFLLGLFLPICFVAGYTGATIPTQWALLSVCLVPSLWKENYFGTYHWLGLGFLVYAALSLTWTIDYGFGFWIACIWALSFWYGSTQQYLHWLWRGLALGLGVNSIVAIFQAFGYQPVLDFHGLYPSGLLFNSTALGLCIAFVAIPLIIVREWVLVAIMVPGFILANSFGAYVVLGSALIAKYTHWTIAALLLALGNLYMLIHLSASDTLRIQIWNVAYKGLTFFGYGAGSFIEVFFMQGNQLIHPEFVHNDYLQLWFEYGIGALPIYIILATALHAKSMEGFMEWPILFASAVAALFYFPLWCPITAFITCVVAGHILRRYDPVRDYLHRWRPHINAWAEYL